MSYNGVKQEYELLYNDIEIFFRRSHPAMPLPENNMLKTKNNKLED